MTKRVIGESRRPTAIALSLLAILGLVAILFAQADSGKKSGDSKRKEHRNIKRYGAVGDGKTDDTAAIQNAVNKGIGTASFPRGVYRVTKTIVIDLEKAGFTSMVGDGTATILMAGPGPAFRFIGTHQGTAAPQTVKSDVWENQRSPRIEGIEIVGAHEEANGIEAIGTMQLIVSRVLIRKAKHGIHLVNRNRNVIISDCHIYENRGVGIFYDQVNLHQSNIIGCHISYNDSGGVVIRGGNVRNVHIGTCDIEGNMSPKGPPTANVLFDATGGSIGEAAVVGCTIQHSHNAPASANIRIKTKSTPVKVTKERRHGNFTIADNVLSDVQVNVDILNTRGVTITGNTIWKGYQHDLRVTNCANVVVANNVFDRNPRYNYSDGPQAKQGLIFTGCSDCTLTANHSNGTGDIPATLIVNTCRRFNISGCTFLDYPHLGLQMINVTDSRVSDCLIRADNTDHKCLSLQTTGGRRNMIVDNLLGNPYRIEAKTAHTAGNYDGK